MIKYNLLLWKHRKPNMASNMAAVLVKKPKILNYYVLFIYSRFAYEIQVMFQSISFSNYLYIQISLYDNVSRRSKSKMAANMAAKTSFINMYTNNPECQGTQ